MPTTPIQQTQPSYKLTVRDLFWAFFTMLTGVPQYETISGGEKKIWKMPTIKTLQVTPDATSKKIYASGITYDVVTRTKGASASLATVSIPREVMDKAMGGEAVNAVTINKTNDKGSEFSMGYYMEKSDGSLVYYFHPRCKLTPGAEDFNDLGDNDPDPSESMTIEIMPTAEGVWRVRYDTADAPTGKVALTADDFFGALPYTIAQITALANSEQDAPGA